MKFSQEQINDTILKESLLNIMIDQDTYMQVTNPLHYEIDKDIVVNLVKEGNYCYISIYNDRTDKSVAVSTTRDKLKGLADFLNKHLGNN